MHANFGSLSATRKAKIGFLLVLALLLASVPSTQAALQVGPIDPNYYYPSLTSTNSSFPAYYMDDQGIALDLLPITGDGVNAPTQIYFPKDPASPYSNLLGFESEAFYYFARSIFNTKNGKATATFGLEASFVNGIAQPGQEMVFVRIRLKCPVRDVGTYTFTHPWGVETIQVSAADITSKKGIAYTRDVGLVPRAFDLAASGPIQHYVKQLNPPPADPVNWIGDGASVGTITPGPTGIDFVLLMGPPGVDLDGRRNNFVKSNQFTISGRVAGQLPTALNVERATCFDLGGSEYIDVFASSDIGATVEVSGATVVPTNLTGDGTGKFYGHVPGTGAHGPGPFPITVTASHVGAANTVLTRNVVDNVEITAAEYSLAGTTLSITAISTDGAALMTSTVAGTAQPVVNDGVTPTTFGPGMIVPPATVTVTSNMGGSDTRPVQIVP